MKKKKKEKAKTTVFSYDGGLPEILTDTTHYQIDAMGNCFSTTVYDANGDCVKPVRNNLKNPQRATKRRRGQMKKKSGKANDAVYDKDSRLIASRVELIPETTYYEYDAKGNCTSITKDGVKKVKRRAKG